MGTVNGLEVSCDQGYELRQHTLAGLFVRQRLLESVLDLCLRSILIYDELIIRIIERLAVKIQASSVEAVVVNV